MDPRTLRDESAKWIMIILMLEQIGQTLLT